MKTIIVSGAALLTVSLAIQGQPATGGFGNDRPTAEGYLIKERGQHHRIWERREVETTPMGTGIERRIQYTELETGMHYFENGQWNESKEEIEIVGDHAVAAKGGHKVILPPNVTEVIFLETPDLKQLRSRIWGLSYFDSSTGTAVLIAEVKSSEGRLLPPNRVIYESAFDGNILADVEYVYTKSGFEQNVVLKSQLPLPSEFGLSAASTKLQVLTEFFDPPIPARVSDTRVGLADEFLDFGEMKMGRGKGFAVGDGADTQEVPVVKQWTQMEGRNFLVEEVPVSLVDDQITALMSRPRGASIKPHRQGQGDSVITALKGILPKRMAKATKSKMQMAKLVQPSIRGFVLDYTITLASATNFTFKSDTTHYVSGSVTLYGKTTFEGGTVIKYATSASVSLTPGPPGVGNPEIDWLGGAYRPVIFTAKDDNTVGETISGSTGNPSSSYYGNPMIFVASPAAVPTMAGMRMSYSKTGIQLSGANANLYDAQVVKCQNGFNLSGATMFVGNTLLTAKTNFVIAYGSTINIQNATFSTAAYIATAPSSPTGCNLTLTNCLLANVTNFTAGAFSSINSGHNGFYSSLDGSTFGVLPVTLTDFPFQAVTGGGHYLATNSPCRDVGTLNINAELLASLSKKTTYPPVAFTNTASTFTTLGPQAQRDTDVPDIGYHYDPLDYIFGKVDQNTDLTFIAGTAVGWFRQDSAWTHGGHGIHIADTKTVNFAGLVDSPCWFVHQTTVQENRVGYNPIDAGPGGLTGWATAKANRPFLNLRFTKFAGLPIYRNHIRDDSGGLFVSGSHCEFFGGGLGGYVSDLALTNCLLDRVGTWLSAGNTNYNEYFAFRNCTVRGGYFVIDRQSLNVGHVKVTVLDTAFDAVDLDTDDPHKATVSLTRYDHNAFPTGTEHTDPEGANDVELSFDWQTSWLGGFYLSASSDLVDEGSETSSANVGLYHFTSFADQSKEETSPLNIGYHYVAVNDEGKPVDTDGDGVPDSIEDIDGDGDPDSGETDWADPSDAGLRVHISRPKHNSVIP